MPKRSFAKSGTPRTLKDLDPNFRPQTATDRLRWIDAFDRPIALRGLGWLPENRQARHFRRFPDRAEPQLPEAVRTLSHSPASVFLSFFTDSPNISVRWEVADLEWMPHMPASGCGGVELFVRQDTIWQTLAVGVPSLTEPVSSRALIKEAPGGFREYRLYLPLYKRIRSVAIGISADAKIAPAPVPPGTRPVVFYGTSITQGGCANTAGSDFVSGLGRQLDREVLNFGFSGSGKGERPVAEQLAELPAEAFVLDYAANVLADQLRKTLPKFTASLRDRHPGAPIVLLGMVPFDMTLWNREHRQAHEDKRDVLLKFYLSRRAAGDRNIHFIDGHALLSVGQAGVYVDGVHPTSHGFAIMADRLAPQLRYILDQNR